MPIWLTIVTACIGSTGLFAFIQFLITRHDNKKGQMAEIQNKLHKLEKDSIRTQLLVLMSDYPEDKQQIMMLGEYYFDELKSNWYMTGIFQNYLERNNIPTPPWFKNAS